MTDWTGKVFGAYRLDAALGPDRYGTRYRATDTGTGASVEVRLIAPPMADDRWFADRVASALRRYVGVSAPDLAPLLAVGEAEGAVYTVGPLLAGATLRARLGAPLPPTEVVALLGPIAAALDALHARYLPHGGVCPAAIIDDPAGLLLRDAGVAPAVAAAARLAAPAGTAPPLDDLLYRAPEAHGGSSSDPRADIYSLAAVAYELLTGQPPFSAADAGGDAERLAALHRDTPPPAPRGRNPGLAPATEVALLRGLAKFPYARPERASAFIAALGEGLGVMPSAPPDVPVSPPAPSFAPAQPIAPPLAAPAAPIAPTPTTLLPSSPAPPTPVIVPSVPAPTPTPTAPPVVAPPLAPEPYQYQSPETSLAGPTLAASSGEALQAGRTALVTALAALAQGRQRTSGTLRAVEARQRAGASEAASRPTPTERAARYAARTARERTEWREFYSVPLDEAVTGTLRSLGSVIFVAIFIGSLVGRLGLFLLILIGAVVYGIAKVRFDTRRTISCTPDGFAIEDTLLPGQTTSRAYRWSDVSDLRYFERLTGSQKSPKLIGSFVITVADRVVADCTDRYPGLDLRGLIDRFGRETTHLPYRWVPNDDPPVVSGGQRAERYLKIAREAGPQARVGSP